MKFDLTLYLVTDSTYHTEESFLWTIEEACKGGVTLLQIREKERSGRDYLALARKVKEITDRYDIPLIVDDRIDIALAVVAAPTVEEAPLSIECRVRQIIPLGTHDMFLAEVVAVLADDRYIDPATGRFALEQARPIVYMHGAYYELGRMIDRFGWSVRRKKPADRKR